MGAKRTDEILLNFDPNSVLAKGKSKLELKSSVMANNA
jgi:hypothetical protein